MRSGRGSKNEGHEATRAIGRESAGERTAGWRAAAGEIGGREWAKKMDTRAFR